MFGGNQTDKIGDYDENELSFQTFKQAFNEHELFPEIEYHYLQHRSVLQKVWSSLPQGAVQGDFCYYNMLKQQDGTYSILDFNLAGNEIFLNECIAVGVYHSWHVPYTGRLNAAERFRKFIAAYEAKRPFTSLEREHFNPLLAIIRAFRFDRIEDGAILKETAEKNQFVKETLDILTGGKLFYD